MSIIARDPQTGEMGVAVESHYFSVGPVAPWAEAGVGAVATQATAEPLYGQLGLEMMRYGKDAPSVLSLGGGRLSIRNSAGCDDRRQWNCSRPYRIKSDARRGSLDWKELLRSRQHDVERESLARYGTGI